MSVLLLGAVWLAATGLSAAAAVRTFGWFAYQPIADRTFTPASGSTWALTEASITARALDPACILMIIAAVLAFVASFLKAAFGLCLGCQLSMVLTRAGLRG